ncbi:MAG: hypothetical protein IPL20_04375 [Saprospiraceae bacterium]|nr:hypothetical protein [Saprospiraceae bacterium]
MWSDPKPETTEGWSNIKDSLVASLGAHQQLEITAFYCNEEKTGSDSDTLAKQRAVQTRALFTELNDPEVCLSHRLQAILKVKQILLLTIPLKKEGQKTEELL